MGLGWSAIALPIDEARPRDDIADLAGGPSGWLAISSDDTGSWSWTSIDARTWLRHSIEEWSGVSVQRAIAWHDGFLVAGTVATGKDAHIAFWTSPDGTTWTRLPDLPTLAFYQGSAIEQFVGNFARPAAWVDDLYVLGDKLVAEGEMTIPCECDSRAPLERWTTSDGVAWTWSFHRATNVGSRPVHTAVGTFATDGSEIDRLVGGQWHAAFVPQGVRGTEVDIWEVAAIADGVLGVGRYIVDHGLSASEQSAWAAFSEDGVNWTVSAGYPALTQGYMTGVASYAGQVIAYGRGGASSDEFDELGNPQRPYVWLSPPVV